MVLVKVFFFLISLCITQKSFADTVVTTYVTKVQSERKSTRFTLTEWLKIKERMKMMDVWLAMFSNPKADKFRPEFAVEFMQTAGELDYVSNQASEQGQLSGEQFRAQVWLTNMLTATTGSRFLNIDFGLEFYSRSSNDFLAAAPGQEQSASLLPSLSTIKSNSAEQASTGRSFDTSVSAASFRVFGKNVQDSSLTLKIGRYNARSSLPAYSDDEVSSQSFLGTMRGADLTAYLTSNIGFEGHYINYSPTESVNGTTASGRYLDYLGFVEVALLRIVFGNYQEEWTFEDSLEQHRTKEKGYTGGVKLLF